MTRPTPHNVRFDSGFHHRSVALGYESGSGPFSQRRHRRATRQLNVVDAGAVSVGDRPSRRSDFTATHTY